MSSFCSVEDIRRIEVNNTQWGKLGVRLGFEMDTNHTSWPTVYCRWIKGLALYLAPWRLYMFFMTRRTSCMFHLLSFSSSWRTFSISGDRVGRWWVEIHSKREQLQSLFVCQPSVLKNLVENSHFKRVGSRCSQSLWQRKRVQASTVENDLGNLDQKVKIRRS